MWTVTDKDKIPGGLGKVDLQNMWGGGKQKRLRVARNNGYITGNTMKRYEGRQRSGRLAVDYAATQGLVR